MRIKTKLLLVLILVLFCMSIAGTVTANAEEETECPVQLYVGDESNIVESGTVTNLSFGVIVAEAGYINIRFPNDQTESRYVSDYLTLSYVQSGLYTIYRFSPASNPLEKIDINLQINLDKALPEIRLFENDILVPNQSCVKGNVRAEITDNLNLETVSVNISNTGFVPYNNEIFTEDGVYEFCAVDIAGNESRATMTKDTVPPTIEIYNGSQQLGNNALTNAATVTISAFDNLSGIDSIYLRKANTELYTPHDTTTISLTESGTYEFYAVDKSGNQSEVYTITIDNVAPILTVTHEGITLSNNSYVTGNLITVHINDAVATGYLFRNSTNEATTVLNGATFTAEGNYTFYATDSAGNKSAEITVTIDRTNPSGSIYVDDVAVANGAETSADFKYKGSDSLSGLDYCQIKTPNGSWQRYTSGTTISADNYSGEYSFRCVDNAGNVSSVKTVILVATTSIIHIDGINEHGFANCDVSFSWETDLSAILIVNEIETEYQSGTAICDEGEYTIIIKNQFDFVQEFHFVIDKTSPSVSLSQEITNGYTKDFAVTCAELDVVAVIILNGGTAQPYTFGDVISQDGSYTIVVTDLAGNSLSIDLTIDTVCPTVTLQGVENKGQTKTSVVISNPSEQATITVLLNGKEISYKLGDTLSSLGTYTVVVADLAGNQTTYTFEILFSLNAAGLIFFVILIGGILVLAVVFLIKKKIIRFKFLNKKKSV